MFGLLTRVRLRILKQRWLFITCLQAHLIAGAVVLLTRLDFLSGRLIWLLLLLVVAGGVVVLDHHGVVGSAFACLHWLSDVHVQLRVDVLILAGADP